MPFSTNGSNRILRALLFVAIIILVSGCGKNTEPADQKIEISDSSKSVYEIFNIDKTNSVFSDSLAAESELLARIKSNQDDPSPYIELGYLYLQMATKSDENLRTRLMQHGKNLLEIALKKDPNNIQAIIGLQFKGVKKNEVERLFDIVIQIDPRLADDAQAGESDLKNKYFILAGIFFKAGSDFALNRSVELNLKTLELYPGDLETLVNLSKAYLALNDIEQSKNYAIKAIKLAKKPDNSFDVNVGTYMLGLAYKQEGNFDKAEELFKKATIQEDGKPWACAYQSLGWLYTETGRPGKAAEMEVKVAGMYSENPHWGYQAALKLLEVGNYTEALVWIDRAIKLKPLDHFYSLKGLLLLFKRDYENAKGILDRLVNENPDNLEALTGLGHLAIINKDYDQAVELFSKSLVKKTEIKPFFFEMACIGIGWAYANRNMHTTALHFYDQALKNRADSILALLGKGNSLIGLQKADQAQVVLERVLELQPGNPYAKAELAVIRLSKGEVKQAEEDFKQALSEDEKNYTCPYEGLGLLYLRQGEFEKAKRNFEKAIKINPDIEYKKFNGLAKIYIKEGRIAEAEKLLKKSIENFPYNDEAKKLLDEISTGKSE